MMVAMFSDSESLRRAAARLREEGMDFETYTPAPLNDESDSPLPLAIALAGLLTAFASFALQTYSSVIAYPINIGGRPAFSWPSFVPTALENGILASVVVGVLGYFAVNRLPRLYEPIDELPGFREASRDGWFLATQDSEIARKALSEAQPLRIQFIKEVAG